MNDLVILGSSGFAKEVAFLIESINKVKPTWNIMGYVDNQPILASSRYPLVGDDDWLASTNRKIDVAMGIGIPSIMERLYQRFAPRKNLSFPNLIHPNVIADWSNIVMGAGNIICASNAFTTDISLGNCNIINLDCTIGHDSQIGDFNVINPSCNISGDVHIGNRCLLGTGATILQQVHVANDIIIGGQSLVNKTLSQAGTYVGVPTKKIK